MTEPVSDREALAAYLARMRSRLPGTATTMGNIAERALSLQESNVDPETFNEEFSGVIRSLQALGVTMDNASKSLAKTEIEGSDPTGAARITCTATLGDLEVHLGRQAMSLTTAELEHAISVAFEEVIRECRDITLTTVESASTRVRHHTPPGRE